MLSHGPRERKAALVDAADRVNIRRSFCAGRRVRVATAELPAGTLIEGRYRLVRVLGQGGFGAVYLAEQLATGQQVALKVLLVDREGDPNAQREVARFQREMRLVGQLAHPNVVRLIDFGEIGDGRLFIAFEYIRGENLAQLVERGGAVPVKQAQRLMLQVLEALSVAHRQGIVHRDLKPHNVMVTNQGPRANAMVVDFGVSFVSEEWRDTHYRALTARDELAGTPPYMAPEQLLEGQASALSDIYSWGLVFLEAVTGQPAYEETSFIKLLLRHSRAVPVKVPDLLRDSPLGPVLETALAFQPDQRYATADDALHALEAVDWRDFDLDALEEGLRALSADWRRSQQHTPAHLHQVGPLSPSALPGALSIDTGASGAHASTRAPVEVTAVDSWNDRLDREQAQREPLAQPSHAVNLASAEPAVDDTPPAGVPVAASTATHSIPTEVPISEDDLDYSLEPTLPADQLDLGDLLTPSDSLAVLTGPKLAVRTQPLEAVGSRRRWVWIAGSVVLLAGIVVALVVPGTDEPVRERVEPAPQPATADTGTAASAVAVAPTEPAVPVMRPATATVTIPGGSFVMGCDPANVQDCPPDASPAHLVEIDPFDIDVTEVTIAAYAACVEDQACDAPEAWSQGRNPYCNWGHPERADHPVNCVTWYSAQIYCEWRGRRLPTEAEWELAARGALGATYPWGSTAPGCELAVMTTNDAACRNRSTAAAGSRPAGASPYGLMDMAGNVWEWTTDWYGRDFYDDSPSRNPVGPPGGEERVIRGGGYDDDDSDMRTFTRNSDTPWETDDDVGFRCAASR